MRQTWRASVHQVQYGATGSPNGPPEPERRLPTRSSTVPNRAEESPKETEARRHRVTVVDDDEDILALMRDIIAGTFIFIEDQFVVGDTIEVNGIAATVEEVSLRSTRLRDFQGRELHVPNGEMKVVVNHSRGWQRAVVVMCGGGNMAFGLAFDVATKTFGDVQINGSR